MGLRCVANSSVTGTHKGETERRATAEFRRARPVRDRELLPDRARRSREVAICRQTGICTEEEGHRLDLEDYARKVTDALLPPAGTHDRVFRNTFRLFVSNRISTAAVAELVRLSKDLETITDFRNKAHEVFSGQSLFFYDYFPHEGAVVCFIEPAN